MFSTFCDSCSSCCSNIWICTQFRMLSFMKHEFTWRMVGSSGTNATNGCTRPYALRYNGNAINSDGLQGFALTTSMWTMKICDANRACDSGGWSLVPPLLRHVSNTEHATQSNETMPMLNGRLIGNAWALLSGRCGMLTTFPSSHSRCLEITMLCDSVPTRHHIKPRDMGNSTRCAPLFAMLNLAHCWFLNVKNPDASVISG